jgi:hypothetical protein
VALISLIHGVDFFDYGSIIGRYRHTAGHCRIDSWNDSLPCHSFLSLATSKRCSDSSVKPSHSSSEQDSRITCFGTPDVPNACAPAQESISVDTRPTPPEITIWKGSHALKKLGMSEESGQEQSRCRYSCGRFTILYLDNFAPSQYPPTRLSMVLYAPQAPLGGSRPLPVLRSALAHLSPL